MRLLIAAALLLASPASANDSSAELAAGGIVLTKTDAITMQREDLALSPSEVRVRYEMRNDTGQPVTLRVAFPMPEVPHMTPAGMTTGPDDNSGPYNIALRPPTDPTRSTRSRARAARRSTSTTRVPAPRTSRSPSPAPTSSRGSSPRSLLPTASSSSPRRS